MRTARTFLRLAVPALVAAACAGNSKIPESKPSPPSILHETPPASEPAPTPETPPSSVPAPKPSPAPTEPPKAAAEPAGLGDGAHPGFRVPPFIATVLRPSKAGVTEQPFDSRATKTATLYVVNSTTCPYCALYVDRMKALETKFMPLGVDVVHVYPNRKESAAEKTAWHAKQAFRGGQILDADAGIARALEADRTPTVYLVSGKGLIVYRGAIDESAHVEEGVAPQPWAAAAIEAQLAGRPIAECETEPEG